MQFGPPSDASDPHGLLDRRAMVASGTAFLLTGCQENESFLADIERPALPNLRTHTGWTLPGFRPGLFRSQVALLNVWASWCGYCRAEHGVLKSLEQRLSTPLYGLVYLDKPEAAAAYLRQAGNPFRAAAIDIGGKMAKSLGQRGVPSTYVIGHDGKVMAKWGGGLNPEGIDQILRPGLEKARKRQSDAARVS